jgi:hypothetical protein
VRIASTSTTLLTAATQAPVAANPSGITFQAALASSSEQSNARDGATGGGSKTHFDASAAGRPAAKQEKAQSPSGLISFSAPAAAPIPLPDRNAAPADAVAIPQTNSNRAGAGSSGTFAESIGVHASTVANASTAANAPTPANASAAANAPTLANAPAVAHDMPRPLAAPQPAVDGAGRVASVAKPLDSAVPQGGATAGAVQAVQPTIPGVATPGVASQAALAIATQAAGGAFNVQVALPMASASPSDGNAIQPAVKTTAKSAADATATKNSDLANTTDEGKGKVAEAVGASAGASSNGSQSNGQPTQHSQPDGSQAAAVMPKVMDGGASQVRTVPLHAVSFQPAATPHTPDGLTDSTHQTAQRGEIASSPLDGDEAVATSGINAAKLIQTMGETEMRVGMHSSEFGNISIRTSVSQQQMLAQISLDHGDLSQAISAHISTMQTKLGNDSGLATLIQVNHQGASSSGEPGSSRQGEQRAFVHSARSESAAVPAEIDVGMNPAALAGAGNGYRLDIRA